MVGTTCSRETVIQCYQNPEIINRHVCLNERMAATGIILPFILLLRPRLPQMLRFPLRQVPLWP